MAKPRIKTYQNRIILFLDILGFREVVEETTKEPHGLGKLISALSCLVKIKDTGGFETQSVTHFSDSVVVSYRVTEESAVVSLLNSISLAIIGVVSRGYLVRGAVTVGQLYHTANHLIGPAMVKAYVMESQDAIYPRVLVDPALIEIACARPTGDNNSNDEEGYVREFMTEDDDGKYYIDYVSWDSVVGRSGAEDDLYPDYLKRIGELVGKGLKHTDPNVAKKYLWLHRLYVASVCTMASSPQDSPYRTRHPGVCEYIAQFPKHHALAKAAQKLVDRHSKAG